jgi:hypothetical protein
MTETFTFKHSPLALMPLRLWLVKAEINRSMKWLARHSGSEVEVLLNKDLRERTHTLYHQVDELWARFDIAPTISLAYDDLPFATISLVHRVNYILTQEYSHYSRLLRREEYKKALLNRRARRLLPSWIKANERHEVYIKNQAKSDWKTNWFNGVFSGWNFYTGESPIMNSIMYSIFGGLILAFILTFYSLFMTFKEEWLNSLAKIMVAQSIQTGASFQQIYSGFGAAILIGVFVCAIVTLNLAIANASHQTDNSEELADGLTEIAYMIEHQPTTHSGIVS